MNFVCKYLVHWLIPNLNVRQAPFMNLNMIIAFPSIVIKGIACGVLLSSPPIRPCILCMSSPGGHGIFWLQRERPVILEGVMCGITLTWGKQVLLSPIIWLREIKVMWDNVNSTKWLGNIFQTKEIVPFDSSQPSLMPCLDTSTAMAHCWHSRNEEQV